MTHTRKEANIEASSVNPIASRRSRATAPKTSPAVNALTKPFPPISTAPT